MAKSKLTPKLQARVVLALKNGNYQDTAARLSGIAPSTFYDYIQRGERDIAEGNRHTPHAVFSESVKNARAEAEVMLLANIVRAGSRPENWQASAWVLERTMPAKYGRRTEVKAELTGAGSGPIQLQTAIAAAWAALGITEPLEGEAADGELEQ